MSPIIFIKNFFKYILYDSMYMKLKTPTKLIYSGRHKIVVIFGVMEPTKVFYILIGVVGVVYTHKWKFELCT